jgi:hypothetical protein
VEVFGNGTHFWGVLTPDGTLSLQDGSGGWFRGAIDQNRNVCLEGRNGRTASGTMDVHGMLRLRDERGNELWGSVT